VEATEVSPRHVPRRRLPVHLQLSDGRVVVGEAYVAIGGAGHEERLLDRLNDSGEHFLPIAVDGRHLLVRKMSVVSAWTTDMNEVQAEAEAPRRDILVEVVTSRGPVLEGHLRTEGASPNDRALDVLNGLTAPFVALLSPGGIALVNTGHVVAVLEQHSLS
jgi:hypothetical protein